MTSRFPLELFIARRSVNDLRTKKRKNAVIFPFGSIQDVSGVSQYVGSNMIDCHRITLPSFLDSVVVNLPEHRFICVLIAKIVHDGYKPVDFARVSSSVPLPLVVNNEEIQCIINDTLAYLLNDAQVIDSDTRMDDQSPFCSELFEVFNEELIIESVEDLSGWNSAIQSYITNTALYRRRSGLHAAVTSNRRWSCELQLKMLQAMRKSDDKKSVGVIHGHYSDAHNSSTLRRLVSSSSSSSSSSSRSSPMSNYIYAVTHPNGAVEIQQALTKLQMHIGQYRFSPLPLSVDRIRLGDRRLLFAAAQTSRNQQHQHHQHQQQHWIYESIQQFIGQAYRSIDSAYLTHVSEDRMSEYLAIAQDAVSRGKTLTRQEEKHDLQNRQTMCNVKTALHTREGMASEIIQAVMSRTDLLKNTRRVMRVPTSRKVKELPSGPLADGAVPVDHLYDDDEVVGTDVEQDGDNGDSDGGDGGGDVKAEVSRTRRRVTFSVDAVEPLVPSSVKTSYGVTSYLTDAAQRAHVESQLTGRGDEEMLLSRDSRRKARLAMLMVQSEAIDRAQRAPMTVPGSSATCLNKHTRMKRVELLADMPSIGLSDATTSSAAISSSSARVVTEDEATEGSGADNSNSQSSSSSGDAVDAFSSSNDSSGDAVDAFSSSNSSSNPIPDESRPPMVKKSHKRKRPVIKIEPGTTEDARSTSKDDDLFGAGATSVYRVPKSVSETPKKAGAPRPLDVITTSSERPLQFIDRTRTKRSAYNYAVSSRVGQRDNYPLIHGMNDLFGAHPLSKRIRVKVFDGAKVTSSDDYSAAGAAVSSSDADQHLLSSAGDGRDEQAASSSSAVAGSRHQQDLGAYKTVAKLSDFADEPPAMAAANPVPPPSALLRCLREMAAAKAQESFRQQAMERDKYSVPEGLSCANRRIREAVVDALPPKPMVDAAEGCEPQSPLDPTALLGKFTPSAYVALGVIVEELMRDVVLQYREQETLLQFSERNLRIETFVQLRGVDPRTVPLVYLQTQLEELFGRKLDGYRKDIALYHRVAIQRHNAREAQAIVDRISTPSTATESSREWKLSVGLRTEFENMPEHIAEAREFYQSVKARHSGCTRTLKRVAPSGLKKTREKKAVKSKRERESVSQRQTGKRLSAVPSAVHGNASSMMVNVTGRSRRREVGVKTEPMEVTTGDFPFGGLDSSFYRKASSSANSSVSSMSSAPKRKLTASAAPKTGPAAKKRRRHGSDSESSLGSDDDDDDDEDDGDDASASNHSSQQSSIASSRCRRSVAAETVVKIQRTLSSQATTIGDDDADIEGGGVPSDEEFSHDEGSVYGESDSGEEGQGNFIDVHFESDDNE